MRVTLVESVRLVNFAFGKEDSIAEDWFQKARAGDLESNWDVSRTSFTQ